MSKKQINTDKAPAPLGAYSQAITAGNMIFVAGQVAKDPATGEFAGSTIAEQTTQVVKNIEAILQNAGAGLEDVVKTTVHLSDLSMMKEFNEAYAKLFPDPKPARTTVGSQLVPNVLVEIDVIAVKS